MKSYTNLNNSIVTFEINNNIEFHISDDDLIILNSQTNKTLLLNETARLIFEFLYENTVISNDSLLKMLSNHYNIPNEFECREDIEEMFKTFIDEKIVICIN